MVTWRMMSPAFVPPSCPPDTTCSLRLRGSVPLSLGWIVPGCASPPHVRGRSRRSTRHSRSGSHPAREPGSPRGASCPSESARCWEAPGKSSAAIPSPVSTVRVWVRRPGRSERPGSRGGLWRRPCRRPPRPTSSPHTACRRSGRQRRGHHDRAQQPPDPNGPARREALLTLGRTLRAAERRASPAQAAMRDLPLSMSCGSSTNFFATPLSKSL